MKKKILFFDIDGTLYNTSKQLPQATRDAIEAARANGHEVAIATGRSPYFLESVARELNVDSYVSFNGQYVVYKGELISHNPLPVDVMKHMVELAYEQDSPLVFLDDEKMSSTINTHEVKVSMDSLFYPMPTVQPEVFSLKPIYQMLLYADTTKEKYFRAAFPELHFIRWHDYSLDVINKGVSKAYGIEQFLTHTDFEAEDVVVFGDGLNDREMLEAFATRGTSVAMGNGVAEAKAAATFVTDHVDNDGLAKAMQKIGLI